MRPREHDLIDPEIAEQLDAIDATLAGDPVDPRFAEVAELALLLAVDRPEAPRPEFAHELDRRVQARFRRVEPAAGASAAAGGGGREGGRARRWRLTPAWGAAGTALAAVVVGIAVVSSGGGTVGGQNVVHGVSYGSAGASSARSSAATATTQSAAPVLNAAGAGAKRAAPVLGPATHAAAQNPALTTPQIGAPTSAPPVVRRGAAGSTGASRSGGSPSVNGTVFGPASSGGSAASTAAPSPAPVPNGRKIIQSSSLQLGTQASRIDAVAQEVFDVVGAVQGIVDSSNVASTGGPGASAQFRLRIPSGALNQALSALSRLRYANVISRIDNTRDVNSSFVSARRQIADAQAALVGLRQKLAAATTQTDILSLKAQIANENATIKQAQASLQSLNRQVDYSRVYVSIQADGFVPPPVPVSQGGGFGLHQAGHDALRVLQVSAGVALIALAVLIPIGLLAALGWWFGLTVQRRRRERALDLA
jgi:hypothetical protein